MSLLLLFRGAAGPAAISTLKDNFDDNTIGAQWVTGAPMFIGGSVARPAVAETGGQLQITNVNAAGYSFNGYKSADTFDWTGGSSYVQVPQVAQSGATITAMVAAPADTAVPRFTCYAFNGQLRFAYVTGGENFVLLGTSIAFNATNHRWWRIRFDATTAYLDVAPATAADPPAAGEWVLGVISGTIPAAAKLGAMHATLESGTISGDASLLVAKLDGFNTGTVAAAVAHDLTAIGLTTGAPTLSASALGQVHSLTAVGLTTGAPTLGTPALGLTHDLVATSLTTGAPTLGAPALGQRHSLTAAGLTTGVPTLGAPALGQGHSLTAVGLTTGAPALGAPVLGQTHSLNATGLSAGAPTLGAPALGISYSLTATGLTTGAPVLGAPALGVVHNLIATPLVTGRPTLGTPLLTIVSAAGQLKVWLGNSWQHKPVKVWNGTGWVQRPVKYWNGTSWIDAS